MSRAGTQICRGRGGEGRKETSTERVPSLRVAGIPAARNRPGGSESLPTPLAARPCRVTLRMLRQSLHPKGD